MLHLGLVHDGNLEIVQLEVNFITQFRCDGMACKDIEDVAVGQVALFLGEQDQFLDFFGEIKLRRQGGG
jgi:hypothetical protein